MPPKIGPDGRERNDWSDDNDPATELVERREAETLDDRDGHTGPPPPRDPEESVEEWQKNPSAG